MKLRGATPASKEDILASSSLHVKPTDHGGDPTGRTDSTAALQACIQVCVNQSLLSPNGVFPGTFSFRPKYGAIRDAGGCFIDLDGGEYRISQTLAFPELVANINMGFGSIVAGPSFPASEFLIQIGIPGSCKVPQGSCNIDINFPEIFVSGSRQAAGCFQINNVMGTTIGPGGYLLNFTQYGVQINDGHEVMIERTWMGETNFDYDFIKEGTPPNATAIQINGNDHYLLDVIVFSSRVGVEVHGAADYVSGVHVWFPDNVALHFNNTAAFHIFGAGNRFDGCYIDGNRAIFEQGALSYNIWDNGFECCAAVANVPHGIVLKGNNIGPGLQIIHNEFHGGSIWLNPESTQNETYTVTGTLISQNSFQSGNAQASRVTKTLTQKAATTWNFNFCKQLLPPVIQSISFSVMAETGTPNVVARPAVGCTVSLVSDTSFSGSITATVDASVYDEYFA
eukprot:m.94183 g.94183  ORF g.94183 m.94183 type:complete len:453 (+) comp21842_c0_seq6:247-1605(+)